MTNIIKKPVITEKSIADAQKGIYTFLVSKKANKVEIAREVAAQFKVHVKWVTTVIVKGKKKIVGRKRNVVSRPDFKKARVKLKDGEKIAIFEVGGK